MPIPRKAYRPIFIVILTVLGMLSLACRWSADTPQSSAPEADAGDIEYLRALAFDFYRAASRQDVTAIVRMMDSADAKKFDSCEDLARGFSDVHFTLTGIEKSKIQVTIFPQSYADKKAGVRRAWTRDFNAKISVDGAPPADIRLGQDKFINRGSGWKLVGFYIGRNGNDLPYPFTCGRTGSNDWY